MTTDGWESILGDLTDVEVRWREPLARHTTFHVGGSARCLVLPRTEAALIALTGRARTHGIPTVVLGGGSNVLAPDDPLDAMVIQLTRCCSEIVRIDAQKGDLVEVVAGAGVRTQRLLRFCMEGRLGGLEFLVGIPAMVGGALVMNAGTGDGAMADVVSWIEVMDGRGIKRRLDRKDLSPAYRSMGLSSEWIVLRAGFRLRSLHNGNACRHMLSEKMRLRKQSQPLALPSAG
jgi:UDP-N-acetylmuramate dehydrogenase